MNWKPNQVLSISICTQAGLCAAVLLFSPARSSGQTSASLENDILQPRISQNAISGSAGYLVGWGDNYHGGINLPACNDFTAISAGYNFSLGITKYPAWISRVVSKTGKPGKPVTITGRGFSASTTNKGSNKVYFSIGIWPYIQSYQALVKSSAKDKLVVNIPKNRQSGKPYSVHVLVNGLSSNTVRFRVT